MESNATPPANKKQSFLNENPTKSPSVTKDVSNATQSSTTSSSISTDSRTSTLKYSQEPFDEYRLRVEELCHVLWPTEYPLAHRNRRVSSTARSRILNAVRVRKFRRAVPPSLENEFLIERLAGGIYNRIIGITVKNPGDAGPRNFVLRIPRPLMADFGYIEREVAILRCVRQNSTLPVADVISFDQTTNNPLKSGYVVQNRLPGTSLHSIWDELTHEQRCKVAREIGKIILALQAVTNPTPGIVESSSADNGSQKFSIRPFDIKSPYDDNWKAKIPTYAPNEENQTVFQTPEEWFGTQFGRWLAYELLENPAQILYWDYQSQFVQVTKQMGSLDILGDGYNCLCHFDFAARNIMVEILADGSLTVTGILDWDSAAFAPKFVSCAPPSWLWTEQKYYDAEEGETSSMPSTPEQEQIKEAFDDVVGFDYTWLAYKPEYRLARELFYFARHGLQDGEAQKRAVRLLKEWEALHDSLVASNHDVESNNGVSRIDGSQEGEIMDETGHTTASE